MKKLLALILSAMMVLSCAIVPAAATEVTSENDTVVMRRDFLQAQTTKRIYHENDSSKYVDVTIKYSLREDLSNRTKYRIVGIGKCSVAGFGGWYDVESVEVYNNQIAYSDNNQIADVTIRYYAGGSGAGYAVESPCTGRYARWCERSALMGESLLLDLFKLLFAEIAGCGYCLL